MPDGAPSEGPRSITRLLDKVPGGFAIAIPVFRSGVLFPLFVRLRYRVGSGKVGWSFCLHRPDHVFQAAFRKGCELARDATALPLFYGTPES